MAFASTYRILFEVRILHTYYIRNEGSLFSMGPSDYYAQQATQLQKDQYNILQDMTIEPTTACKKLLRDHRMRLGFTPTGFIVGTEVEQDGANFAPFIAPTRNAVFSFRLKAIKNYLDNYSNISLQPNLRSNFYLNNFKNKTPIVSGPANLPLDSSKYLTEADRQLIGSTFQYRLNNPTNQVTFKLYALSGALVRQVTTPPGFSTPVVKVDFKGVEAGDYQLKVLDQTNTLLEALNVYINDVDYDPYDWALIEIADTDVVGYQILNGDYLIQNLPASGHPVFDVRIQSRSTFRRYFRHPQDIEQNNVIADGSFDPPQINATVPVFTSLTANPLKYFHFPEAFNGIDLPGPTDLNIKPDPSNSNVCYSEIYLPKINL